MGCGGRSRRRRWRTRAEALAGAAQLLGVPAGALPAALPAARAGAGPAAAERRGRRAGRVAGRTPDRRAVRPGRGSRGRWWLTCRRCGRGRSARGCSGWPGRTSSRSRRRTGRTVAGRVSGGSSTGCTRGIAAWCSISGLSPGGARSRRCSRAADVVIEASRPRALAAARARAGDDPAPGRPGLAQHHRVRARRRQRRTGSPSGTTRRWPAGWSAGPALVRGRATGGGEPVFCADAIADPLTGLCGALAVARSVAGGGGRADRPVHARRWRPASPPPLPLTTGRMRSGRSALAAGRRRDLRSALRLEQAVLPPRPPAARRRRRAEMGADTAAVLAWLGRGRAGC